MEYRINILDEERQNSNHKVKNAGERDHDDKIYEGTNYQSMCRHHNRGYCKHKSACRYKHPQNVCESVWSPIFHQGTPNNVDTKTEVVSEDPFTHQ